MEIKKIVEDFENKRIKEYQKSRKKLFLKMEEFFKENVCIITGVRALKMYLDKVSYDYDIKIQGYEIYTQHPKDFLIRLMEFLPDTWKVIKNDFEYNFELYYKNTMICKAKKINEKTLENIPIIKVNDLNYVDPIILFINYLTIFVDPQENVSEWLDTYKYFNLLNNIVPIQNENIKISIRKNDNEKFMKKIYDYISKNKIIIGKEAFNLFMKLKSKKFYKILPIDFYEILSETPEDDIKNLESILSVKLEVQKFKNEMKLHGDKYILKYKNNTFLHIYNSTGYCLPIVKINNINIGNYHVIMLYLNLAVLTTYRIKSTNSFVAEKIKNFNLYMIAMLEKKRNDYLKYHSIIGIDNNSPFDIFQDSCIGMQINHRRNYNIKKWNKEIKSFYLQS